MIDANESVPSITELATLEIIPPSSASSSNLMSFLREASTRQGARSGYPVLFFQDAQSPTTLYLISGWQSISAHEAWIASEENQTLLRNMSQLLRVKGLVHIAINFQEMPTDTWKLTSIFDPSGPHASFPAPDVNGRARLRRGTCVWGASGGVVDGKGSYAIIAYAGGPKEANDHQDGESTAMGREVRIQAHADSSISEVEMLSGMSVAPPESPQKSRATSGDSTPRRSRNASPRPHRTDSHRKSHKRRKDKRGTGAHMPKSSSKRGREEREEDPVPGSSKQPIVVEDDAPPKDEPEVQKTAFIEEFIAFPAEDTEGNGEKIAEEKRPVREWDRGKGKGRDYDGLSRKRKVEEVDGEDGYGSKRHRFDGASCRAPWAVDVDWEHCNNVAELLHREVEAFVKYISPTPEEDEIRSLVVQLISNAVSKSFPDARVLPFGSYQTKLYLPVGDIDLVIESQSMAYSNKTAVLHALANTVKKAGITDRVSIIAKAKVPIIKFVTRHGHFPVDISINQINGVAAGEMVKRFVAELPALRSLVLIIKSFLSQRSMNEVFTGGLGSYSIVCLAISFLQLHPKIRRGELDPSKNLGVLVVEFFELYGCYFNYQEVGISVRDGGSYYNKSERGWADYRNPGLLSIEDPGDSSNDISRGSYNIAKVRTTFAGAFSIMTAKAYNHANMISARRERRYVRLQNRLDPEDMSILGSVMGVTQETVNHRRLVQEVYDNRTLHRMLGVEPAVPIVLSGTSSDKHNGIKRSKEGEESIRSAWEEADADPQSPTARKELVEEEESRYDIETRLPPKKRRRHGTKANSHVYISDDEDDDERGDDDKTPLVVHALVDSDEEDPAAMSFSEQEDAYDIDGSDDSASEPETRAEKARRTRSYWLSKAISA
ncbi:hypothetical protein NM688_g6231 [Phlebia brevispora]|uniref:Uncharacterized protein n=1 Tax=Phlebia brevispora TaxID=194682 RepID=A0ACC1SI90_9APHY|nr:hypothetical protein NM688_g6231 [Phlebia brevispora]